MSKNKYCYITLLILFVISGRIYSQEKHTEIGINFRVNSVTIDTSYSHNAIKIQEIISLFNAIKKDSTIILKEVSFCGAASPEGSYQLNRRLARGRLTALENIVRQQVYLPDSIVTRNDSYIPWETLKGQVSESDIDYKQQILQILEEEANLVSYQNTSSQIDDRINKLKSLDGGKVWKQMNERFFSALRNAYAVFVTFKKEIPVKEDEPLAEPEPIPEQQPQAEPVSITVQEKPATQREVEELQPEVSVWTRNLHVKTNILGLGMAIANAAVEVDLFKHCSVTVPVYYSAWDYFKSTIKFRTLATQPELRFWLKEKNDGFFAGAHFGFAYYNLALDGDYRFQDHNRQTPAIGGGISLGYRFPISRDGKWRIELGAGAGCYPVHYDKFHNTPDTKDGLMVSTHKKTYIGLDQASATISYAFDLSKKGGKR